MKHFFDIGGHHGETFDYLATLPETFYDCQFWVFEPSPRHFATLLAKCRAMSEKYDIHLCPFGIGGHTRLEIFYEKDDDKGDSFQPWLASDHEVKNISNGYAVRAAIISLPEVIIQLTNPNDDIILDIDAEGSEYEMLLALLDARKAFCRVKHIMVEWHDIKDPSQILKRAAVVSACDASNIQMTHRGIYR